MDGTQICFKNTNDPWQKKVSLCLEGGSGGRSLGHWGSDFKKEVPARELVMSSFTSASLLTT